MTVKIVMIYLKLMSYLVNNYRLFSYSTPLLLKLDLRSALPVKTKSSLVNTHILSFGSGFREKY